MIGWDIGLDVEEGIEFGVWSWLVEDIEPEEGDWVDVYEV